MQWNPPEWNWCKHCVLRLIYINFMEIQVGPVATLKVSTKTSHVDCIVVELQQHITIMSHFWPPADCTPLHIHISNSDWPSTSSGLMPRPSAMACGWVGSGQETTRQHQCYNGNEANITGCSILSSIAAGFPILLWNGWSAIVCKDWSPVDCPRIQVQDHN